MAIAITRMRYNPAELRDLAVRSRDTAQSRRLLASAMVLDGGSREGAARQAGMDRQTLRDWVHRFNDPVADGLVSRRAPGRARRLAVAQMPEFRALAVAGPDPAVHHVARWRCVDLRDEVARRFGVAVQERAIGKWLRKLGPTRLQPRPYHPKRDAAAAEASKKTSGLC
jgi:transposase